MDIKKLDYRKGVYVFVIDNENNFLIIQSLNYKENEWSFPGGGIEENESPEATVLRELHEELGSDKFKIIKKSKITRKFDFDLETIEWRLKEFGTTHRGQEQIQFLVKFMGDKNEIIINTNEILNFKWVKYEELKDHLVFPGQWEREKITIDELLKND